MRYLIAGGALLLAGVVAALLFIPMLVDDARFERHLAAAVMDMTGHSVDVAGDIDVKLLPQPLLTVYRPALGDDRVGLRLTADRLDLEVALIPLLLGRMEVTDAHLVRPELHLASEPVTALLAWPDRAVSGDAAWPWRRLGIVGGRVVTADGEARLHAVDGTIEREGENGGIRFTFDGRVSETAGGGTLRLDGHRNWAPEGRPVPLQAELALTRNGAASRVEFRGFARPAEGAPGLDGRLAVDLPTPPHLADSLPDDLGEAMLALLPDAPLSLETAVSVDFAAAALRLDEAVLVVDGQRLAGALVLDLGASPEIALELLADRLDLPDGAAAASDLPFAMARAVPAGLRGTMGLHADLVEWQAQTLRQVTIELVLDGAGTAEIARASAVLPGPGDLAFTGRLAPLGPAAEPHLAGRLSAAVQEPALLARSFTTPPEALGRSATLSIDTDLDWGQSGITLRGTDLRLDALHAVGGLAWRAGAEDRPPQLALQARIDRLALDDILDLDAPEANVTSLLDQLASIDLALDLRVERTSLGEARFGGLVLDLDAAGGEVTIGRLSLADIAGSAATLTGGIDAGAGSFDLDLAIDLASLPRLQRLVGHEPQPTLALLGPLNLRARLVGDGDAATIEATLDADRFAATATGQLDPWQAFPSGALRLTLESTEAAALLRQLGGVPITDPLLLGPLEAAIDLTLEQAAVVAASLEASLGTLSLALEAERQAADARPLDRFALTLGPLAMDTGGLLYRLATPALGLVPGPPTGWLGYWPAQELDWAWLRAHDVELALTLILVDPTLPPLTIIGHLRDGLLTVPALRFDSERGLVEAGLALEARSDGRGVDLAVDLAAQDLAAADFLAALGLDPEALAGELDLEARLRSSGGSLRKLVANLQGEMDLVVSAAKLGAAAPETAGIPIDRLAAALAVERGVLRPAVDSISFAGPEGTGRLDGSLDLLAWMVELELALDGHDGEPLVRQRLFGPLGEPLAVSSSLPLPNLPVEPAGAPLIDRDASGD